MRARPAFFAFALAGATSLLSGCVAALVPIAAAGAIGKTQVIDEKIGGDFAGIESYFRTHDKSGAVNARTLGSVTLAPRSDLQKPTFTDCGERPRAMLVDIDGTPGSILDPKLAAKRHERLALVARQSGARLLYFTARPQKDAKRLEKTLSKATGLNIRSGNNLFLADASRSRRDLRRWDLAQLYCVVAMVGDAKQDFTDSYAILTQYRAPSDDPLDQMIGNGWFLIPGLDPF